MDFLLSIVQNDIERARQLIQAGVDVNCPIPWNTGNTFSPVISSSSLSDTEVFSHLDYYARSLNIAVLGGHIEMVGLLLSAGADINVKDGLGRTALICAIYGLDLDATNINVSNLHFISQSHKNHLHIMKNILLQHPNIFVATLNSPQYEIKGITPLCLASYLGKNDIIKVLLEDGRVDVDGTDSKNATALMYAARDGNLAIVDVLLGFGASPGLTDSHGWSAIQYAERNPKIVQLCEYALRRKRPGVCEHQNLPSEFGSMNYRSNYTKLSTLISTFPQYNTSLSHVEFDALQDLDLADPMASAIVQLVQSAFLHAIKSHDHTSLQSILLGSPPLQPNNSSPKGTLLVNYHDVKTGLTCIHHAMRAKPLPSLDTIRMLYESGADVNGQTYYGRTALHHLARIGADKDGRSWGIQKSSKSVQQVRARASSNASAAPSPIAISGDKEEYPPGHTGVSPISPASPASPLSQTYHRLSIVSSRSNASESATIARSSIVDVLQDPLAKSILAAPTVPGHLALCASLLIRLGALVNIADPTGNTPLHFAAEFGAVPEVLEVLVIEGNADLNLKNKKQQTPLDICKTEEIRKCLLSLEQERRSANRTKSLASHISGNNIKPFDTASDYHQSLSRSTSLLQNDSSLYGKWTCRDSSATQSVNLPTSISEVMASKSKEAKRKGDVLDHIDSNFEIILKTFFTYQTTFTDSIEKSLAIITETILHSWQGSNGEIDSADVTNVLADGTILSLEQLEQKIAKLRSELKEAHDMFDNTEERSERVMLYYREELEQIEQIHQADCELLELQQDKVSKLLDVFERIDSRFCQLEGEQDDLIQQVGMLRQMVMQHLKHLEQTRQDSSLNLTEDPQTDSMIRSCCMNLIQSLTVLTSVPATDSALRLREDWHRLLNDLEQTIVCLLECKAPLNQHQLALKDKWNQVKEAAVERDKISDGPDAYSPVKPHASDAHAVELNQMSTVAYWRQQQLTATLYSCSLSAGRSSSPLSLNEIELKFDILSANLNELQNDIGTTQKQIKENLDGKKRMHDAILALELELELLHQGQGDRCEDIVQEELVVLMHCTKSLFENYSYLEERMSQLKKEKDNIGHDMQRTKYFLRNVRPPLLLQGLLERLETVDSPSIPIEQDWQEDASLVVYAVDDQHSINEDESTSTCPVYMDGSQASLGTMHDNQMRRNSMKSRLKQNFNHPIAVQCLLARMDTSLYCLKVLASHHINRARQVLVEVQGTLGQASIEVEEAQSHMAILYEEAAEVARQVYVFKTEVEMIIRHRKEEVVKVWEVVDEVSAGLDARVPSQQRQQEVQQEPFEELTLQANSEDEDRHQWILRELERFQVVHENLQDAIEDLKREQGDLGQRIRHLATSLIEPQVDKLVGQSELSLLSLSDNFAEMIDTIRMHDIGLDVNSKGSTKAEAASNSMPLQTPTTKPTTGANRNIISAALEHSKRSSMALSLQTAERKRMSVISTSSLSSLSSYQQERMLSRASNLSQAVKQRTGFPPSLGGT
ncbi:ankyrin [Hesseltinella vesiculosa]|uniref:Ankyrin n=1 Tax=Hesseltinella vesiculosa TaxID=101127 RepID=A0A1X2G4C1_9FUNG|nr:ankyrin [Hesseltinella vesiculosa]